VNLAGAGTLARLPPGELAATGCRVAIHPGLGMLAAAAAMESAFETLRKEGSLAHLATPLLERDAMNALVGFDDVEAFESRWHEER
jgi:2-methylisocitrate lyase-like PEP mutase family enzyme